MTAQAKTRCKFRVERLVTERMGGGFKQTTIKMVPVYSDKPDSENKVFWDATPNGVFEFSVTNNSLDHFSADEEYYIDIIPAPIGE